MDPNEFEDIEKCTSFFNFHESFIKIQLPEASQDSLFLESLLWILEDIEVSDEPRYGVR